MKNAALFLCLTLGMSSILMGCSTPEKRVINPPRVGDLNYHKLMLMDLEQMQDQVRKYIRFAKQDFAVADEDPEAEASGFVNLKKALRMIFSRPDAENYVAKLVPEVRRELAVYRSYYRVIDELAEEGIQAFDRSLGVSTVTLATYTFMLENIMGEIQAEARIQPELKATIEKIARADIKVPRDVIQERKLSGMFLTESPSEMAQRILKERLSSQ
ncbi:MAG TPA: hypothetical protein DCL41_09150 [Bdellovibrionales bacterium]|nr:hypothetical protein [Pseudobdellovibrionaceae bacterium]HAG92027.1 hypothetical protein [Bdellovibrionales bacterium]|tara:strand:+ start:1597 stop:2241 length:645 start_codon:yes stop_codon:yes gene_type:complete